MQHKYKGSYYKGNNISYKQFRLKKNNRSHNTKTDSGYLNMIIISIAMILLLCFFYFNKKESDKEKRDNVEDTVELIQRVAKYNLETDLANKQSTETAKKHSINHRNPSQIRDIELEKHKAIILENKRRNDYTAQQYALDYAQHHNNNVNSYDNTGPYNNNYRKEQYCDILPNDTIRKQQTQKMHNVQFDSNSHMNNLNNIYQQKPYQTINSPFIHPDETTRPLIAPPTEYNNTLEVNNKPDMFMKNVPSNVFDNGYFSVQESYESPYLSNINKSSNQNNKQNGVIGYTQTQNGYTNFL